MHVNDLWADKQLFRAGMRVEFELEDGDKGLKASAVRLLEGGPVKSDDDDGLCDVLSATDFLHELTEILLTADPSLTGAQITRVRQRLLDNARSHNWIES